MSTPIQLDSESLWAEFVIGSHSFHVEAFEALDLIREIDLRHRLDAHYCAECRVEFQQDEPGNDKCPSCDKATVQWNQAYLDDVAALLRDRFGAPRCSRTEAGLFYRKIVELTELLKKNSELTPESPTGSM